MRSAPWSHFANRCQSNSVETLNPFASSEPSVQATIIADGMTIRLILEAARLDMHLIRLGPCRFNAKSGSYRHFIARLTSKYTVRDELADGFALPVWELVALLLHLLVTLFQDHRHRRETLRRRKTLLSFIHRLSHNEEEKKRRIAQVIYPYQHGNLDS